MGPRLAASTRPSPPSYLEKPPVLRCKLRQLLQSTFPPSVPVKYPQPPAVVPRHMYRRRQSVGACVQAMQPITQLQQLAMTRQLPALNAQAVEEVRQEEKAVPRENANAVARGSPVLKRGAIRRCLVVLHTAPITLNQVAQVSK